MNIVRKVNFMIPWNIICVHFLLFSLKGSVCEFSLLKTPRNDFHAIRPKRDLLAAKSMMLQESESLSSSSFTSQVRHSLGAVVDRAVLSFVCMRARSCSHPGSIVGTK
uniref:Uncharacterized protein n=1 Tax=Sphaerodactylus townsendi TaxID=933632 RepID=A0ACB8FQG2_9SAUR